MRPSKPSITLLGGTGFIGKALGKALHDRGYSLRIISRRNAPDIPYPANIYRYLNDGSIPEAAIRGSRAIINLAGESLMRRSWQGENLSLIINSRVKTAAAIVTALHSTGEKPLIIQASASGYYGDTQDQLVSEDCGAGGGLLAKIADQWEGELKACTAPKVIMRLGMVLGKEGGAFPLLKKIYAYGLGAILGTGKQYVSWVHLHDLLAFVTQAIENERLRGTYNLVAPHVPTYHEFHQMLSKHAPLTCPIAIPEALLKLGDKSKLVTISQRLSCQKATADGYVFRYPNLHTALNSLYT